MSFIPSAQVVCDSVNTYHNTRLTTFVLKYHRFIHPQFLTHRIFSRNSQSDRALRTVKLIERIENEDVLPLHFGKEQKGMIAGDQITDQDQAREIIRELRAKTIEYVQKLNELGIHKQVANRYLDPFSSITTIVSATDFNNFFDLRLKDDAQPEIQALAEAMYVELLKSEPVKLNIGDYHIPFIAARDIAVLTNEELIAVAVTNIAKISYLNHLGETEINDALAFFERLKQNKHASPFEHVARACTEKKVANYDGFASLRHDLGL